MSPPVVVLKFGGSVLRGPDGYERAVHEVYRHWRRGRKVVAVVSAASGVTDALLDRARAAEVQNSAAAASLLASGERESSAWLGMRLERAGIPNVVLDPFDLGLEVTGGLPAGLRVSRLAGVLGNGVVAVVPGFFGVGRDGGAALMGRGGSDLTALFLAAQLGGRCRLIKDVGAVYPGDPALSTQNSRFRELSWEDARRLGARVVQPAALEWAQRAGFPFDVGGVDQRRKTVVGSARTRLAHVRQTRPLRVVLLGLGTIGEGVYRHLAAMQDRFEIVAVAVRHGGRDRRVSVPVLSDATEAAQLACDVVVEAMGGEEPARSAIALALSSGRDVVTANKLVVARHLAGLRACSRGGARLLYSAAVGGAAPFLETVRVACRAGPVLFLEGVLNGTTNFVLDRMAEGATMPESVAEAQRLGYAEADPTLDLEGADAAMKLALLAGAAFGRCDFARVRTRGITALSPGAVRAAVRAGLVVRLVARASRHGDVVHAEVRPRKLTPSHPLSDTPGVGNRLVVYSAAAGLHVVSGAGAGRWPTAEAMVADLLNLWRHRVERAATGASRTVGTRS